MRSARAGGGSSPQPDRARGVVAATEPAVAASYVPERRSFTVADALKGGVGWRRSPRSRQQPMPVDASVVRSASVGAADDDDRPSTRDAYRYATAHVRAANAQQPVGEVRRSVVGRAFDCVDGVAAIDDDALVGVVAIERLLSADDGELVGDIMYPDQPRTVRDRAVVAGEQADDDLHQLLLPNPFSPTKPDERGDNDLQRGATQDISVLAAMGARWSNAFVTRLTRNTAIQPAAVWRPRWPCQA